MAPYLSLVIASFNEAEHLDRSFPRLLKALQKIKKPFEIIFVDDYSQDNTVKIITKIISDNPKVDCKFLRHKKNFGRGRTVTDGIKIARGKFVGFIDIDLEISPNYIAKMLSRLKQADVIVGWRKYSFSPLTMHRYVSSKLYALLVQWILKLPVHDTEAGYKFFNRKTIMPILRKCKNQGWFWDTEVVAYAHLYGLTIAEVPVRFIRRLDKTSTVKIFSDSWQYLKDLLAFRSSIRREQSAYEKQQHVQPTFLKTSTVRPKPSSLANKDYLGEIFTLLYNTEPKHFWFYGRARIIQTYIKQTSTNSSGKHFIDVGCGTGYILPFIEALGFRVVGLDVYKTGLQLARTRTKAQLICADINSFRTEKKFDAVGAFDVLEHVSDEAQFLRQCSKLLKKYGSLFITVPAHMILWSKIDEASGHKKRYTKSELAALLSKNGFRVEKISYYGFFLFFPQLLFRKLLYKKLDQLGNDPAKIIAYSVKVPPKPINTIFTVLLALERSLLTFVGLPFGASLIVHARKA